MCPTPFQWVCFCLSPSLFGTVVINSVCCQTPWGGLGQHCCGQLSRCGLETMDVLGGNDATEQLLKQRTELSKSTITLFLPWIENEGKNPQNIKTCWVPRNTLVCSCRIQFVLSSVFIKDLKIFAVDTALLLQSLFPGKNCPVKPCCRLCVNQLRFHHCY